jgi:lipoprotein-anchoring transpeptidase ErfK/SrfK
MRIARRLSLFLCFVVALAAAGTAQARDTVSFPSRYRAGDIVIMTGARQLFFVLDGGRAIRYPVGVGKAGMAWHGRAYVALKRLRPAWQAPPELGGGAYGPVIAGGSPRNPMGAAVLGLDRGNYAIHGTNNPSSVGGFVSHGCIRMFNEDVLDLYARVTVGTEVIVLR